MTDTLLNDLSLPYIPKLAWSLVVDVTLLEEPVTMHRPRSRIVKAADGRQWIQEYNEPADELAKRALRDIIQKYVGENAPRRMGPLRADIIAFVKMPTSIPKKRRLTDMPISRPDWDNLGKLLCDAAGPIWHDNSQIVDGRVRKLYAINGAGEDIAPRWLLRVWQLVEGEPHGSS